MTEKIRAGFDLYDEDDSGFLSFSETSNFLTGFFKILFKNPVRNVNFYNWKPPNLAKYSPDKLGQILAFKCFEENGIPVF